MKNRLVPIMSLAVALTTPSLVYAEPPAGPIQLRFSSPATLSPLPETIHAVESTGGTDFEYTFHPEVDMRGRVSGRVDVRVRGSIDGLGSFDLPISGPLSGKIKGRSGSDTTPASKVKLTFALSGTLTLSDDVPRRYKLKGRFAGIVVHAGSSHALAGRRVFKLDGTRPDKASSAIAFDSAVDDERWSVLLEIEPEGAKLAGSAVVAFDGRVLGDEYEVRGKYSEKTDLSSLVLKAPPSNRGSSLKITRLKLLDGGDGDFLAKYKFFGHKGSIPGSSAGAVLSIAPDSSEGSRVAPVDISGLFPYRGMTAGNEPSYYRTDLLPGAQYELSFDELDGEALSVELFHDSGFEDRFCNTRTFSGAVPCPFTEDADGEVFIRVESGAFPARYTLRLELIDKGGFDDEGTSESPLELPAGGLPHDGTVWRGTSFYRVSGLTPGEAYTVTLSDFDFEDSGELQSIEMRLSGEGVEHAHPDCADGVELTTDAMLECVARAHADGFLRIEVEGRYTAEGAGYSIAIAPGGLPNEGFDDAPLDITDSLPWNGSVHQGGSSQYLVTGLSPGVAHLVQLLGTTQELQLQVWALDGSGNRVEQLCRTSYDPESSDEACEVTPPTDAIVIWAATYSDSAPPGATFTVDIEPSG